MEGQEDSMLDSEFRRYLKILKPYIGKLLNKDVFEICNAWIQKLSSCNKTEKTKRNKYMFTLCYQLARGSLRKPFTRYPSSAVLNPLSDESESDNFSEVECQLEDPNVDVTYINQEKGNVPIESLSIDQKKDTIMIPDRSCDSMATSSDRNSSSYERTEVKNDFFNLKPASFTIGNRAKNLILKLREIKNENVLLRNQLLSLKEETNNNQKNHLSENFNNNVYHPCSKAKANSDSRIDVFDTVNSLQQKCCPQNEIKNHEIETLVAKHNLELLKTKTEIKIEAMETYENKIFELTQKHEDTIENIRRSHENTLENLRICNENKLSEKDKIIKSKEMEILRLNKTIEELESQCNKEILQRNTGTQKLEERISKIEKSRNKYFKAYENKLLNLQREKHMSECSFQLQLVKQKAQIVSEMTDENQIELVKALEKLENKYKDIVAKVQATALHRRMRDQLALETLMKAICDIPNEGNLKDCYQLKNENNMVNPNSDVKNNHICHSNRIGIIIGNKTLKGEDIGNNVFHDDKNREQILETIHIPQKDINDY